MDSPHRPLDRLLPRHQVRPARVEVDWDVRPPNRFLRRPERFGSAEIVDLSLDGALVEADLETSHEIGDVVTLRVAGASGRAVIKHKRLGDAGTSWLYGVQWVASADLKATVERAVEQLRESKGNVRQSWEQHRR